MNREFRQTLAGAVKLRLGSCTDFMNIEYRRINHVTVAVPAGEHEKVRASFVGAFE